MMASLCVAGRIPNESEASTNLVIIGAKTVVDSLISQVGILSSSHVLVQLAGRDLSIILTPSTLISWKTSNLPRPRLSTVPGVKPEISVLVSSTFCVEGLERGCS